MTPERRRSRSRWRGAGARGKSGEVLSMVGGAAVLASPAVTWVMTQKPLVRRGGGPPRWATGRPCSLGGDGDPGVASIGVAPVAGVEAAGLVPHLAGLPILATLVADGIVAVRVAPAGACDIAARSGVLRLREILGGQLENGGGV